MSNDLCDTENDMSSSEPKLAIDQLQVKRHFKIANDKFVLSIDSGQHLGLWLQQKSKVDNCLGIYADPEDNIALALHMGNGQTFAISKHGLQIPKGDGKHSIISFKQLAELVDKLTVKD